MKFEYYIFLLLVAFCLDCSKSEEKKKYSNQSLEKEFSKEKVFNRINLMAIDSSDSLFEIKRHLIVNLPELLILDEELRKESDGKVSLVIFINRYPDSSSTNDYSKNFYEIYVGENHKTHAARIHTFFVQKNKNEIFWYNVLEDRYYSLEEFRNLKQ